MHFDIAMKGSNVKKIQEIGYYKLKEYAYATATFDEYGNLEYVDTKFSDVVAKYYRDKNLRMEIFKGIEDIEPYLVNTIVSILGRQYGAFGYLDCRLWIDKRIPKQRVKQFADRLFQETKCGAHGSRLADLRDPSKLNLSTKGDYPSIWLIGDFITFGTAVKILSMMSHSNKVKVAAKFECTVRELMSWMQLLNFVRNQCAHNHDLIDIELTKAPVLPRKYADLILWDGRRPTNRLAIILLIFKTLMGAVNTKYRYSKINKAISSFFNDAHFSSARLGFLTEQAMVL